MKSFKTLPVLLAVILFVSCIAPAAEAVDPPHLQSADGVLVVDLNTGTIMYELNKDTYHSIASLTKMMTCLLAVEAVEAGRVNLTDMVTAQDDCLQGLDVSSSNAGITPGEVMSYQDLLYCALVHSANDACNVLGTYIAGSIGAFVNQMNDRAEQLGCTNTHFVDTCGMLNRTEGHYSCPYDLYLIASEALTHPLFAKVCSTASYNVSATNYRPAFDIFNSNALLTGDGLYGSGYLYDGVFGIKTGFTKPAGYCLVSACSRVGARVMVIVLGCNGPLTYTTAGEYQNFVDSATLYDWAFKNFSNKTMFLAGEPMKRFPVENAKDKGTVALCATENLTLLLPNDIAESDIETEVIPDEGALVAPLEAGVELGTVNVYVKGEQYASVRLVSDAPVELDKKAARSIRLKEFFSSTALKLVLIGLICVFVLLLALRVFLKLKRRQALERKMDDRERLKEQQHDAFLQQKNARQTPIMSAQRAGESFTAPQRRPAASPANAPVQRPASAAQQSVQRPNPQGSAAPAAPAKPHGPVIEKIQRNPAELAHIKDAARSAAAAQPQRHTQLHDLASQLPPVAPENMPVTPQRRRPVPPAVPAAPAAKAQPVVHSAPVQASPPQKTEPTRPAADWPEEFKTQPPVEKPVQSVQRKMLDASEFAEMIGQSAYDALLQKDASAASAASFAPAPALEPVGKHSKPQQTAPSPAPAAPQPAPAEERKAAAPTAPVKKQAPGAVPVISYARPVEEAPIQPEPLPDDLDLDALLKSLHDDLDF